jgi:hypothetical protein
LPSGNSLLMVILYQFRNDNISIQIEARFENGDLVVEGYDIGNTVKEYWGDSDYEYEVRVRKRNLELLCKALKISSCNEENLLQEIAGRFNGNKCFSEFREFLDSNRIECEGFSWV